ncbi:hypothetical protein DV738_g2746, partial [Chaetothyriales sp. CBS 135597]
MGKLGAPSGSRADRFMEDELRAGFQWEKSSGLVGMSHNCDACCNFERMEDGRHRQIAELLAEVRELSSEQQLGSGTPSSSSGSSRKSKAKKKVAEEATPNRDGEDPEEPVTLTTPMTPTNPLGERHFNSMNSTGSNGNHVGVVVGGADPNPDLAGVENLTIHDANEARVANANGTNNTSVERRAAAIPPSPASPEVATPSPKLSKAALRANKRAAKQAKSQLKAAKNQTKHTVSVKSADVQFVAEVIHGKMGCGSVVEGNGNGHADAGTGGSEEDQQVEDEEWNATSTSPPSRHPIATDTCIEDVLKRNLSYVAWIREHNAEFVAKKKPAVDGSGDGMAVFEDTEASSVDDMDALVDAILFKFGITDSSNSPAAAGGAPASAGAPGFGATNAASGGGSGSSFGSGSFSSSNMSSAQAAVLARLRVEIAEDLRKHENEQRMTCMRAGGFWRYAGKGVFDRMTMLDQDKEWKSSGAADGSRAARQDNGAEGGGGGCG